MKDLVKKQLIKDGFDESQILLLAVSGGVDSMVMWSLVHKLGLKYAVAHVNFQLRKEQSDLDEELVSTIAEERNIPCHILKSNTKKVAQDKSISIQMAAREIRYNWFTEILEKENYDFLCTAHHLNDSIETFFINLDRGTGIRGLTGISANNNILRPLITLTKEEIRNYAFEQELHFREDQSNANNKYQRNWFRNSILSQWQKRNPAFSKTMSKNLDQLSRAERVYEKAIENDLVQLREELKSGFFRIDSVHSLQFPEESLYELLSEYGFSEIQIQNLQTGIKNHQVGFRLLSDLFELNLDREKVFLVKNEGNEPLDEVLIYKFQPSISEPFEISFNLISELDISYDQGNKIEYLDFDKLRFPLKLRKWEKGDKMKPLGMKGFKKISDILIDLKVPLIEKKSCWVLVSDQKIVWLVGYRVSEEFKMDSTTNQVLKIQLVN